MPNLNLLLLGPSRIEQSGTPRKLSRRKGLALLSYLALTGEPQQRETLATLLWPDVDDGTGRAYLRRELAALNKELGNGLLQADNEQIGVNPAARLWLDVAQFQLLVANSRGRDDEDGLSQLLQADALYRGDFMAGFTLADTPLFDEWQFFQREGLRQAYGALLEQLVAIRRDHGDYATAIPHARRWLALDPLHEPVHRQLMQLYAWSGQHAAALRQFEECCQLLEEELDAPPEEATRELYGLIKARRLTAPETSIVPMIRPRTSTDDYSRNTQRDRPAIVPAPHHNLPPQPTPLIGRADALTALDELLAKPEVRLITIVGPGGMGKSRLSIDVAYRQSHAFADGVTFVSLAAMNPVDFADSLDPLLAATADALKLAYRAGAPPLDQLLGFLQSRQILLVLDNFEHLLNSATIVTAILNNALQVKIMVTSRERLNLREEWLFPLHGLTYPDSSSQIPDNGPTAVETYSALQLFDQRARQVQPNFDLAAEYGHVCHICRLVEGLPLGIELAAAWIRQMPSQNIVAEIQKNIDFLASTMLAVPDRHRSLRAVFEHSWQLLVEPERAVLRKLSIFRGGFEREAAEAVAETSLWVLSALVDKSMLQVNAAGRYSLHELLRQLAEEKLRTISEEEEAVRHRHATYYTAFLRSQEGKLKGAGETSALSLITADIDNVRLAWRWATAQQNLKQLGQAMEVLWLFYEMLGWYLEGKDAFDRVVRTLDAAFDQDDALPETGLLLARGMTFQAWFMTRLGDHERAKVIFQDSLARLKHSPGDTRYYAALNRFYYAVTLYLSSDYLAAHPIAERTLNAFETLGDSWGIGKSHVILGQICLGQGHYEEVEQHTQAAIAILETIGDRRFTAYALSDLGRVAMARGEYEQAERYHNDCLRLRTELGDQGALAFSLKDLADLSLATGRFEQAMDFYRQSLAIAERIGSTNSQTAALWGLGMSAHVLGRYAEAKMFFQDSLNLNSNMLTANYRADFGWTLLALAEYQAAEQYFTKTVQAALNDHVLPIIIDAMAGLAVHLAVTESTNDETVLELLTLVLHHPACHQATKEHIASHYDALVTTLSPEAVVAAQVRGQALDLMRVAAEWTAPAHS